MPDGLVVVGGSYAAVQIAASARERGFDGPIRLVGEEEEPPYQRPPLSKGFLTGKTTAAMLPLRAEAFYRNAAIDLVLGTRVTAVDRIDRVVTMADGRHLRYDRLALALGARPRPLPVPGAGLDGVLALRTLADAERLRAVAAQAGEVVVVGGGFIGLEVASALVGPGRAVTVVEAQDRLLARALPPAVSEFLAGVHRARGVRLALRTGVRSIDGTGGRVRSVTLDDGRTLGADLVVVGIGAVPNAEIAQACGLPCDDGILVDRFATTADPAIVAAGDCTRHPNVHAGRPLRLESVQNALDQARAAAGSAMGTPTPHDAVPWFWSDQYEVKLQMAGLSQGADRSALRGSADQGRFSLFHFRDGRLIAVDSVNRPADHMAARRLLAAGRPLTAEQAADESIDLKLLIGS
ncbi:NAD(P)/FAD-dependent oxidoreductase [Arenibaculum sp.]|uniref:NAD(P)/FAD-dependent oxidoreductase n=1 Tax=Arenibaculum sp. TaxID=2865862 RepID=UPI002E10D2FA|nr:FAD-dependent oxidoreductase [Arenibaculum sp.]